MACSRLPIGLRHMIDDNHITPPIAIEDRTFSPLQ